MTAAEKTGSDWNAFTASLDCGLLYSLSLPKTAVHGVKHPRKVFYLTELCSLVLGACQMQSRFRCWGLFLIHVFFFPPYSAGFEGPLRYRNWWGRGGKEGKEGTRERGS